MVVRFLLPFLSLGFLAKILGEVVHEIMGHGLFVLAFGGRITSVIISLTWPYELSQIGFVAPVGGFEPWQEALVDGGGVLVCLVVSFTIQAILLLSFSRRGNWVVSSLLFWLAFWTFINPAGYLVVGGIEPFGDVANLISAGILTQELAFGLGFVIFLINLFTLSIILRNVLVKAGAKEEPRWSVVLFWLIVPLVTLVYVVGHAQSLLFALLGFIPVVAASAGLVVFNAISSHGNKREIGG